MNWSDASAVTASALSWGSAVLAWRARHWARVAHQSAEWLREEADQWRHAYGQVSDELMRITSQQSTVSPADTGDTAGNDHNPDRS